MAVKYKKGCSFQVQSQSNRTAPLNVEDSTRMQNNATSAEHSTNLFNHNLHDQINEVSENMTLRRSHRLRSSRSTENAILMHSSTNGDQSSSSSRTPRTPRRSPRLKVNAGVSMRSGNAKQWQSKGVEKGRKEKPTTKGAKQGSLSSLTPKASSLAAPLQTFKNSKSDHAIDTSVAKSLVTQDQSNAIEKASTTAKAKEVEASSPRRSSRNHDLIRVHGTDPFRRRLHVLFFNDRKSHMGPIEYENQARLELHKVHGSPTPIYEINNFLKKAELSYFERFAHSCSFQKSFVDNMDFGKSPNDKSSKRQKRTILDTEHRTSTFFGFKHRADPTIRAIEQRTAALLGCWVHQIEGLQLVRYLPGQFFGLHHDLGELLENDEVVLPKKDLIIKRRLVTIFVYLNDLDPNQGGCTYFPKCGLKVQPVAGKAILWSNVGGDGYPDPNTIHAGEAVVGDATVVKYGLNVWITEE